MGNEGIDRWLAVRVRRRHALALAGGIGASALLAACGGGTGVERDASTNDREGAEPVSTPDASSRPAGWTAASHAPDAAPDFALVFPADRVNRMEIVVAPATWAAMLDNLTSLLGARGAPGRGPQQPGQAGAGGPQGGGQQPQGGVQQQPVRPGQPGAGRGPGGGDFTPENPAWAKATIRFNGKEWTNVGLRFKGNSSLNSAWRGGTDKLPFKLDFDEFEDEHPEVKDQRFYGFRQLSLSSNFGDETGIRETVAYDIFEHAGLVAANTAPYEVLLDRGEGPVRLGLYTLIEVIDDTVIERSFKDATGAIYEGDGRGASFALGTLPQIESSFQVEGGEEANWADLKNLYNVLHAANRVTDGAAWRKQLEAVFDVETFLEWLAISATLQHWDTYGAMTHNYYLYNNPATNRLTWISWDHNEVLKRPGEAGPGRGVPVGGAQPGGAGPGRNVSLDRKEVGAEWPLIRFLLDQPTYYDRYRNYLKETVNGVFNPDKLVARYTQLAGVITPHLAAGEVAAFQAAIESLKQATRERHQAVTAFLATA